MKYEKINLESYNLHFITTDKFKTTTVSVNFREKIKKEDITIRKFLFQMLCSTSLKYNTNRLFEIKLEDLYSISLGHSNVVFGNLINSYIDIKFLNEEFSDENLLSDSLDLLFELIFNPNVKDERFDSKSFNLIKDKMNLILNSEKENIQKYTLNRSLELMDKNDPVSFNLWGYKEDLDKITEESLYKYYKEVLKTNIIDIFIVGNVDKNKIIKIFREKFKINTIKNSEIDSFITYDKCPKTIVNEETMNLKQSKISIILKALNLNMFERRYVLPLYTSILGSGGNSRLFQNVREKHSLAYTITAVSKIPNSLVMIYGGIDACNYDEALKLIKKEIKLKNVSEEELENAKREYISSINILFDSPASIINYYFGIEVFDADEIHEKINNFNKVTVKDIESLSKKMKVATIYLLKGTYDEENNN